MFIRNHLKDVFLVDFLAVSYVVLHSFCFLTSMEQIFEKLQFIVLALEYYEKIFLEKRYNH